MQRRLPSTATAGIEPARLCKEFVMSRVRPSLIAAAAFAVLGATSAAAYDGGLVRIEPRPYYGAVVTVEQGVRVYRPLPTQNLMIINPNKTPVNLSFSRTIEHKAADGGGSGGNHGNGESDGGSRSSGFSGLGTNPQVGNGGSSAVGVGGPRVIKRHVRKPAQH
jgi:uncharacterized membrane protein YgcG